jgi:serine incorporator 1/3
MLIEFTGCPTNNAFISLTIIFCLLLPVAQLTGSEGNLLSVACISAWAVFLCYTAVTKNPDADCNPRLGEPTPVSITFGLIITLISLGWAGWSYTAEDKFSDVKNTAIHEDAAGMHNAGEDLEDGVKPNRAVTGIVVTQTSTDTTTPGQVQVNVEDTPNDNVLAEGIGPSKSSNSWKLNIALAVVSCWSTMTLTQWGVIQSKDGTIANRDVGRVGMWVIIGSQWLVMTLYLWTLVAPRLFPGREFN